MKKIIFIFTLVMYCRSIDATEIRRLIAEPYHNEMHYLISSIHVPGISDSTPYFCAQTCYKFYDTLVGYTNCPCTPDDTVTSVYWLATGTYGFSMMVDKGTVFYKCWDTPESFSLQPSVHNGMYIYSMPGLNWVFDCKARAEVELVELESSCNYKKLQILDKSKNIWGVDSLSKWYLTVTDSLNNIVQSDSGFEISPFRDSALTIIENQRPSPIIELNQAGMYAIHFVINEIAFELWSDTPSIPGLDTSTIYVRVEDCLTSIKDNSINNSGIRLQMLSNNQLHIQNVNEKKLSLNIYSIDGRNLFNVPINTTNASLDMNRYNKGMYIVSISENEKLVFSNKIVLQ